MRVKVPDEDVQRRRGRGSRGQGRDKLCERQSHTKPEYDEDRAQPPARLPRGPLVPAGIGYLPRGSHQS
jgi:hypothetical protein